MTLNQPRRSISDGTTSSSSSPRVNLSTGNRARSGCSTCRRRHLKCDEARPNCNRCKRSKVDCSYAIRLMWEQDALSIGKCHGRAGVWSKKLTNKLYLDNLTHLNSPPISGASANKDEDRHSPCQRHTPTYAFINTTTNDIHTYYSGIFGRRSTQDKFIWQSELPASSHCQSFHVMEENTQDGLSNSKILPDALIHRSPETDKMMLNYYKDVVCQDATHIQPDDEKDPLIHILSFASSSSAMAWGIMMIAAHFWALNDPKFSVLAMEYRQLTLEALEELLTTGYEKSGEIILLAVMLCAADISHKCRPTWIAHLAVYQDMVQRHLEQSEARYQNDYSYRLGSRYFSYHLVIAKTALPIEEIMSTGTSVFTFQPSSPRSRDTSCVSSKISDYSWASTENLLLTMCEDTLYIIDPYSGVSNKLLLLINETANLKRETLHGFHQSQPSESGYDQVALKERVSRINRSLLDLQQHPSNCIATSDPDFAKRLQLVAEVHRLAALILLHESYTLSPGPGTTDHVASRYTDDNSILNSNDKRGFIQEVLNLVSDFLSLPGLLNISWPLWPLFIAGCSTTDDANRIVVMELFEIAQRRTWSLGNIEPAFAVVKCVWQQRDLRADEEVCSRTIRRRAQLGATQISTDREDGCLSGCVGDIISVCLIVKDLVDALDKCRGSASEYQEIIRELRCLDRSLLEVEKLSREFEISNEFDALCVTAKHIVDKCRMSVNGFLEKIRRYDKYLREDGSGNVVKDSAMKMKWQISKSNELAKFRIEVIAHYSSINALIATAQLNLLQLKDAKLNERLSKGEQRNAIIAERQEATLTDIRGQLEQNNQQAATGIAMLGQIAGALKLHGLRDIGGELWSLMQKTFSTNVAIYRAVLSIQESLLGHLERTLIQEPVILEDAIMPQAHPTHPRYCLILPIHLQIKFNSRHSPTTMADPTRGGTLELDAITPAPTEVLPLNLPRKELVEPPIHAPASEVEQGQGSNVAASRSKFRITMILIACFISVFVAALDDTIVATAIPTITSELHSPSGYAWISGAYLVATAASVPIWAKLSDIWGRKIVLLAAVAQFMGGSVLCALAVDMAMLVAGRALQGAAGGGVIMLVDIVISDVFSMRQRSLFLGLCEVIWVIAGAIGPVLGGLLTDYASWRWCWWINLPCCGVAFVILAFFLDVHNPKTPLKDGIKAVDWAGSVSILAVTIMVLLGLDFGGNTFAWSSPKVVCLIIFGALCSVLFIYSEKRLAKYPLMPLALFTQRSTVATLLVVFFHGISSIGSEFYLPLYFQSAKEASALKSGLLSVPQIVATALTSVLCGLVIHRTGRYRELIWMGPVLLTLGNGLYILFDSTTSIGETVGFQLVAGAGSGLQFMPPMVAMQAQCAQKDVGTATSTLVFTRSMGLAISVVLGGVVFQNSMDNQASNLRAAGIPVNITELLSGKNAAANVMITRALTDPIQSRAVKDAFSISLRNLWIMYMCFSFCGIIASLFVAKAVLSKEHSETITGLKEKEDNKIRGTLGLGAVLRRTDMSRWTISAERRVTNGANVYESAKKTVVDFRDKVNHANAEKVAMVAEFTLDTTSCDPPLLTGPQLLEDDDLIPGRAVFQDGRVLEEIHPAIIAAGYLTEFPFLGPALQQPLIELQDADEVAVTTADGRTTSVGGDNEEGAESTEEPGAAWDFSQ
ncbi:hypothetical protein B7463_g2228, partial [Scytalidium lignicola]